jgi:hypothetical protein
MILWTARSVIPTRSAMSRVRMELSAWIQINTWEWFVRNVHDPPFLFGSLVSTTMAKKGPGLVEEYCFGQTHLNQYRTLPRKFNGKLAAQGLPGPGSGPVVNWDPYGPRQMAPGEKVTGRSYCRWLIHGL